MTIIKELKKCDNLKYDRFECSELYNCCSCGDNDCGCRYCFDCNACETCKENDE